MPPLLLIAFPTDSPGSPPGATSRKPDEFNRMIDEYMAGNIDMVITKSISRFARNTLDCLQYIRQLKDKNIPVYYEKESIITMDAKGEVLITIMASLDPATNCSHFISRPSWISSRSVLPLPKEKNAWYPKNVLKSGLFPHGPQIRDINATVSTCIVALNCSDESP